MVRIWRSTARCYPKCYLPPALPVFSRGLLHSQTRRLQAIRRTMTVDIGLQNRHPGFEFRRRLARKIRHVSVKTEATDCHCKSETAFPVGRAVRCVD